MWDVLAGAIRLAIFLAWVSAFAWLDALLGTGIFCTLAGMASALYVAFKMDTNGRSGH